jgi:hypothetical protein
MSVVQVSETVYIPVRSDILVVEGLSVRPSLLALAPALALAACASPPQYLAAQRPGAPGYSELRIEQNRYRVVYRATSATDARRIEDFALLRAGQVTLNAGYDWFVVDQRRLDRGDAYQGPTATIGVGGGSWRGGGLGLGLGFGIPLGAGARAAAATLDIRLGRGPKPVEANAYDAREVVHSLAATAGG